MRQPLGDIMIDLVLPFLFQFFHLCHPDGIDGIARHAPIPTRGKRDRAYFGAVRQTGTLKLLVEETPVKRF